MSEMVDKSGPLPSAKKQKPDKNIELSNRRRPEFRRHGFPTPVSQIDKLERQNSNLAIDVFGWEKDNVIVHRISEKDCSIPRINLMIAQEGVNTHYSYVKRLTALLYDQKRTMSARLFED